MQVDFILIQFFPFLEPLQGITNMISGSRVYDPRIRRICQKTCFKIINITLFLLVLRLWAITFPMSLFTTKGALPFDLGYFLGRSKLLFLLLFLDLLTCLNSSNFTNQMNLLTYAIRFTSMSKWLRSRQNKFMFFSLL